MRHILCKQVEVEKKERGKTPNFLLFFSKCHIVAISAEQTNQKEGLSFYFVVVCQNMGLENKHLSWSVTHLFQNQVPIILFNNHNVA